LEKQKYKARYSTKMPNGDFLSLTVWPGKTDPSAEVVTVQVRRQSAEGWETVGRLAVYRTSDGRYALLPERQQPATGPRPEPVEAPASGEGYE
jgi:hypothetical protein